MFSCSADPWHGLSVISLTRVGATQSASAQRIKLRAAVSKTLIAAMTRHSRTSRGGRRRAGDAVDRISRCASQCRRRVASAVASLLHEALHRAAGAPGSLGRDLACLVADPGREPGSAFFSEQLTKRSEPQGGRGRRAQNRSVRVVHADSEHRPRPPGGEHSRFVSCSKPSVS